MFVGILISKGNEHRASCKTVKLAGRVKSKLEAVKIIILTALF